MDARAVAMCLLLLGEFGDNNYSRNITRRVGWEVSRLPHDYRRSPSHLLEILATTPQHMNALVPSAVLARVLDATSLGQSARVVDQLSPIA